jgi:pSer/pThr/pTyr-binding forkhead associated (FHA) protein
MVEDLGSTNGTYIDRTRVNGPTVLKPGATLRIGRTALELRS